MKTNTIKINVNGNIFTTDQRCINMLMSMIWGNPIIDIDSSDKTNASAFLMQLSQLLSDGDVDITVKAAKKEDDVGEDVTDLAKICAIKNRIRS